ncbi:MAG: SRPBCC family protein [Nitrospira sp.]
MLKTIFIVIALLIATILIYAATKPNTLRVQRVATINAPPETIFSFITDFHQWLAWSPWEKLDPALKRTYGGAPSGKGALYEWEGNNQVGQGRMEITDTSPPSKVLIKLDFMKPFEAHNTAEFTLAPNGNSTDVTWAMYGPQPYMTKVMSLFFSMDKMVGGQFEQGLTNLKTVTEKEQA